MNNARRRQINAIAETARDLLASLEVIREDEEAAFENIPESLQDGEAGEKMQAAIDALSNAEGDLQTTIESLETASE